MTAHFATQPSTSLPLEPIQLVQQHDDKFEDYEDIVEIVVHNEDNPTEAAMQGLQNTVSPDDVHEFYHLDDIDVFLATPPVSTHEQEIDLAQYRIYPSRQLGNSRIFRGVEKATSGRCERNVTARLIYNEDMEDFLDGEGTVWHVLHNHPHPGFPQLRATLEGESHSCSSSFIVMDNLDVDLRTHIRERGPLPENEAKLIFRQVASAVAHAHKYRISLPPLKSDRIFYTDRTRRTVVLADLYGASVTNRVDEERADEYAALNGYVDGDLTTGCSALGAILFTMLTGTDLESTCLYTKLMRVNMLASLPEYVSLEAHEVLQTLMVDDVTKDEDLMDEILSNEWFKSQCTAHGGAETFLLSDNLAVSTMADRPGTLSPTPMLSRAVASLFAAQESGLESSSGFAVTASFYDHPRSGFSSALGRSRRQSVCVELDTDQVVPNVPITCSPSALTSPEDLSSSGSHTKITNTSVAQSTELSGSQKGGLRKRKCGEIVGEDICVPGALDGEGGGNRHKIVVNRQSKSQRRRHHPYKVASTTSLAPTPSLVSSVEQV